MVPVKMLLPGMRVKIVDEWNSGCGQNVEGLMDKYLGQIVTVLEIQGGIVTIEEDAGDCKFRTGGHWVWGSMCFDCIIEDEPQEQEDFEPLSNDEIISFLFGN